MDSNSGSVGLIIILMLYASVGFMAAAGSVFLTQKMFGPRLEQIFYAGFLVAVAAFYLAFADYFSAHDAWPLETSAVIVFTAFALVGIRFPFALIIGYPLHGAWDLVHEMSAHLFPVFAPGRTTEVPLAYGVFCATYDVLMAAYFFHRRKTWSVAWRPSSAPAPAVA